MRLSDLASLGSFVSGIAVLASLVYLGLQVHQSTKTTRSSAMGAWLADYNSMLLRLGSDSETTRMFRNALTDFEGLSANDRTRFHFLMGLRMLSGEYIFHQRNDRAFDRHIADQVLGFNAALLSMKGAQQWWQGAQQTFAPEFTAYMAALTQQANSASGSMPWFNAENV